MHGSNNGLAKVALVMALIGISASGCLKTEKFPVEPTVAFKSFEFFGDSASLTITFTDGDGDIGLDPTDTSTPFDTGSTYYFNLFLEQEELVDGEWNEVGFFEPQYYRIPRITPTGQNKALEGEIAVAVDPFPLFITGNADTVRYSIELVDRALHRSNRISTGNIIVP